MSTEKPKSPPAQSRSPLIDLPAQPVDDSEAKGVKGGSPSEIDRSRTSITGST